MRLSVENCFSYLEIFLILQKIIVLYYLCVIPLTQLLTDKEFNKHVEIAVEDSKDLIAFHRDLVKRVDKMKFSSYGEISNPFKNWK